VSVCYRVLVSRKDIEDLSCLEVLEYRAVAFRNIGYLVLEVLARYGYGYFASPLPLIRDIQKNSVHGEWSQFDVSVSPILFIFQYRLSSQDFLLKK